MHDEQITVLSQEQLQTLADAQIYIRELKRDIDLLLDGCGKLTPSDVSQRMLKSKEAIKWSRVVAILNFLKHPTAINYGPTEKPCCPECNNSAQNGVPDDAPHLRRCADCKLLFRLPSPESLADAVHSSLADAKGHALKRDDVVGILKSMSRWDHPDDMRPPEYIRQCSVWQSHIRPFMLQHTPKSYKQYIQDFLDGELDVSRYNFCIHREDVEPNSSNVWSYIMGEGSQQLVVRRLFPDEESLMKCYNAIGVQRVIQGVG